MLSASQHRYRAVNQPKGLTDWDASAYMAGFVGDVGTCLSWSWLKPIFVSLRTSTPIAHELADYLWSVLVLSDQLGVDIEEAFANAMAELDRRLDNAN